ncbi:MAG: M36 family metallopeptidase [Sporichthyaceae bacterium]|nr:M36 family metallopeptidase [Sporichthyaceae bacterium]
MSDKSAFYDSRQAPGNRKVLQQRAALQSARPEAGVKALRKQLGVQGIVSIDPLTGTARTVERLDGFLTGPSKASPRSIALRYVLNHPDVFGLSAADVKRLVLRKDYVDIAGTHHLSFIQSVAGVPVFGNGLKANVAANGRLINVVGSPIAALPATAAPGPSISAVKARDIAAQDVALKAKPTSVTARSDVRRSTTFGNGDLAALVYFQTVGGLRLGWQTITAPSSDSMYLHVIDGASGRVLYRRSLVQHDSGLVWENYPGAPRGGVQNLRNFTNPGWLPNNSPRLAGNTAHVYSDVNDDNTAQPSEEVAPSSTRRFSYPFQNFNSLGAPCSAAFPCSWDPATPNSWQVNRAQNAVQVFYFIGKFHDHLRNAPIGFTRTAGNFEAVDGDAIQGESMDGANTGGGLPDSNHVDNANMATPPDGIPPRMQMFLFHDPAALNLDPFLKSNGGDPADIVYHEYTHGLSNRLVVDALGNSTLGSVQAGSMGEGWSDWYALDFLVKQGFERDTAVEGELIVGKYVEFGGQNLIRTQPIDCSVGSTSPACPGTPLVGPGGYTYGDYGRIIGFPEVHADGEIWMETLWDLRKAIGVNLTESLVTRAMELAPSNPSFLDMRNSILMADQVVNQGRANKRIWSTFAARGMGFFAGAIDGDDSAPVEDFSLPPRPGTPTGSLVGNVTDQDTGDPVEGALVGFGGHASGFPGDFAALTDADGDYAITGIFPGTYPAVFARGAGYDRQVTTLSIASHVQARDWVLRRDWAALGGGGQIVDFNGPDFSDFGCGPNGAIDQSLGTGWGSTSDFVGGVETPKFIIVRLPVPVDVSEISIDPGNTCGDGGSASTGDFLLETSTDGVTFQVAADGRFGVADRGRLNSVPLNAGTTDNVQFVRFTMESTQLVEAGGTCPGPFSACLFMDMSELAVYGIAS